MSSDQVEQPKLAKDEYKCGDLVEYTSSDSKVRGLILGFDVNGWARVCGRRGGDSCHSLPLDRLKLIQPQVLSHLKS